MIIGLGNDIIDIRRIESAYREFEEKFLLKIFTELERKQLSVYLERYGTKRLFFQKLANTWAAKESVIKALNAKVKMQDFSVLRAENGAPYVVLHNTEKIAVLKSTGPITCLITMSDEYPYSYATCIAF